MLDVQISRFTRALQQKNVLHLTSEVMKCVHFQPQLVYIHKWTYPLEICLRGLQKGSHDKLIVNNGCVGIMPCHTMSYIDSYFKKKMAFVMGWNVNLCKPLCQATKKKLIDKVRRSI